MMELTGMKSSQTITKRIFAVLALLLVLLSIGLTARADAQVVETGRIMGKVVNKDTGEPLIGSVIMIEGTKLGAQADLDGNYLINNVPVGTYRLIIEMIGYAKLTVENAVVTAGQTAKFDFSLKTEEVVGEVVVVEATRLENSEAAMLSLRQQAPAAQDAISSEAISRSGASDAAAAMSKITGASVVDGKYSVVRGLGERYSNTQLNGSQMPSTDPDRPAVQMDLIPASLLDNIVVQKTFTPDQQGNFSGGSVNINTKDLPEQLSVNLSTSVSYNSNVSLKDDVLTHSGGSKEWLGFDDGFRDPPQLLVDSNFSTVGGYSRARDSRNAGFAHYLDDIAKSLNRDFSFSERKVPLNQGYALSFGNLYTMFGRPLGVLGSLSYNRSYSYSADGVSRRWEVINTGGELSGLGRFQDYSDKKASEEVLWGSLLSANLAVSPEHKLRFSFNRNQHGEKVSRQLSGYWSIYTEENTQRLRSSVWQYTERSMQVFQYSGDHALKLPLMKKSRLDWSASFAKNQQNDPDLRYWTDIANFDENDSLISADITSGYPYPTHFFRYLTEKNREFKADLTIPASFAREGSKIKVGGAYLTKDRHQDNWMMRLNPTQSSGFFVNFQDPSDVLVDEKLGIVDSTFDQTNNVWIYRYGIVPENLSEKTDTYSGEQNITAFYGMIEWKLSSKLDVITGARFEETDQWVESLDSASKNFRGAYVSSDWLPSLNLVYHLLPTMNLRGAFSITTARPTIREMAPFYSYEFLTGNNNIGNPRLTRTLIKNWDLRWEWFTRPGEVVAVSGFYKRFNDPIESFNLSLNGDVSFLNVPRATVYGAEFEFRRRLDHTGIKFLQNFQMGGNLTLVHSEVDIDPTELSYRISSGLVDSSNTTRAFGGQSPYVVNLDLVYSRPNSGTEIALLYNIFGDRLSEVGYRSPDVFEKSRQLVDISASQRLFGWLTAKFAAKNILNEDKYTIQEAGGTEYVRSLYRIGRTFSFGLSYSL